MGFAAAVSNLVDQAHTIADQERRKPFVKHEDSVSLSSSPQMRGRSRTRSSRPPLQSQSPVLGSPLPSPGIMHRRGRDDHGFYRSTSLETRSRTPSPNTSQSPSQQEYYGSTNLIDRSRSPSPSPAQSPPKRTPRKLPAVPFVPTTPPPGMGPGHVAVPVGRGGIGAGVVVGASPAMKPASLNLSQPKLKETMPRVMPSPTLPQPPRSPSSINFPRLSASPTRLPGNNEGEDVSRGVAGGGNGARPGTNPHQTPSRGGVAAARGNPAHHAPPPGRLARPEPYSPTERNSLNKGDASNPHAKPQGRTSGRGSGYPDDPAWERGGDRDRMRPDRGGSPRGPSGHSPDLRTSDRSRILAHQFDNVPSDSSGAGGTPETTRGRGRPSATLPNGFKPKGKRPERYEMRSDINVPLKEDSDEDDDWC